MFPLVNFATHDHDGWPDFFVVKDFFEARECSRILDELKSVDGSSSTVYGRGQSGSIDEGVRKSLRLTPSRETVELVTHRLLAYKDAIAAHFHLTLNECEDPQFLRYRVGDFFVAHQDGNTGMLRLNTERRLISTVIFLSRESELPEPDTYRGGSLVFTNLHTNADHAKFHLAAEPGMFVAFRSETTHEVTPVTHGERHSIVSWYR